MECVWFEVGYGAGKEHPGVVTEGVGRGRGVESGSSSEQLAETSEVGFVEVRCCLSIIEWAFLPLLELALSECQGIPRLCCSHLCSLLSLLAFLSGQGADLDSAMFWGGVE